MGIHVVGRSLRAGRYAFAAAVLAALVLAAPGSGAGQVGYVAQSYAAWSPEASGGAVTGQKPESKLWYAQGSWWAAMVSPTTGAHDIYVLSGGTWVDTGTVIDTESTTKEDVLWDGTELYVLSRTPTTSEPSRLRRFHYAAGAYQLDAGFPVAVPGGGSEAETLAKDSTGTLWVAYASSDSVKKVTVAHTLGSDTTWSAPYALPLTQAQGLKGDDIAAVIAFSDAAGPAVGVAWDNENLQTDFFAVHRDGASDASWTLETTLSGPLQADDHMNLKTAEGRVYEAVKTATTTTGTPLIKLLVRSPTGTWSQYPVAMWDEHNTRPVVLLDMSARQIDVFMSKGDNPGHGIYLKQTSLDAISFPATATPFIVGANNETINNATSTKQNVDSTSGLVVLASDGTSYWWNGSGVATPAAQNTAPTATAVSATTTPGTPVTITLAGTDAESCELAFDITAAPASGTLGPVAAQPCSPGTPNADTATVVYTPGSSFSGTDSFTYRVTDSGGLAAGAPVTVTVAAPPPPQPPTSATVVPSALNVTSGTVAGGDASSLAASDNVYFTVASTTGQAPKTAWTATAGGVPASITSLSVAAESSASASCKQTIEIRDWLDATWVALDTRTIGTTDTAIAGLTPPGPLSLYVDGSGRVRLQLRCGGPVAAFTQSTDVLLLSYATS